MDVVCVGVVVADVLAPGVDRSIFDREMTRVPIKFSTGGDAFNQAVNISSLGHKVALCGKVGDDNIGSFLISEAKKNNINIDFIMKDSEHQTSVTIVLIDGNGNRNFIGTENGTNAFLKGENIRTDIFSGAKVVSIGSLYGSVSFTGKEVEIVLKEAKKYNCITVADMMHASRGSFDDAALALKYVDYFLPNLEEAKSLTKKSDINEIADQIINAGVFCVIIKLGENGCFVKTKKQNNNDICQYVPAYHTENVVDTTGAGDALVSGFISGIIDGCDIISAVKRGCAAGCITVQSVGATGAIKNKEQILSIVNK